MGARVETKYSKSFVLSEENLVRLDDIIRKRTGEIAEKNGITYRVYRSDDFYVDYKTVKEVVSEENSSRNLIKELFISLDEETVRIRIIFTKVRESSLTIEADNRDLAFLLSSDIKEYFGGEVFRRGLDIGAFLASEKTFSFLGLIPILLIPLVMGYTLFTLEPKVPSQALLDSNNLAEKINFLIQRNKDPSFNQFLPVFVVMLIATIVVALRSVRTSFATRVFYWGREIQRYDKRKSLKEKIFWGIVIAFVMGVLATVFSSNILGI